MPDCDSVNLLDLYDGLSWTMLVHAAAADEDTDTIRRLCDYALAKASVYGLRAVLLSAGPGRPAACGIETLVDAESRFVRENDMPASGLLLVRPDGHVARATRADLGDMDMYLARWICRLAKSPHPRPARHTDDKLHTVDRSGRCRDDDRATFHLNP